MTVEESSRIRKAVFLFVLLGVALIFIFGVSNFLHDRQKIENFFQDSGFYGPVLYMLAFIAAQPLSLPGAALIIPATFVWTPWEVFIYSMIGGVIASSVGFIVSRWVAQDWIRKRLPQRFTAWESRFVRHSLMAIIGLRLVTGYAPAADWFLGISKVRWREFYIGTVVGLAPITLIFSLYGDDTVRWMQTAPLATLTILIIAVVIIGGVKRRRARNQSSL